MGFAPIKWTCTAFFWPRQLTDRAILAIRQTQEKKTRQPDSRRGLLRTWKNCKKASVFGVFSRFSLIFALSKKRPYVAKRIVSTLLRTLSGQKNSQKKTQFLTFDSRIPAEGCSKNKIAKNVQFLAFFGPKNAISLRGVAPGTFFVTTGLAKIDKKRKTREREREERWWWWDDDEKMMMMAMMMRWW